MVTPAALVTPERLKGLFEPRSIALVGASERSAWCRSVVGNLELLDFDGPLVPVHPSNKTVFGRPALASLRDLAEPVDLAFIAAPPKAVPGILDDAQAAGVENVVVLAAGYGEMGDQGRLLEKELLEQATANGLTMLGPNGLGYINARRQVAPCGFGLKRAPDPGPVSVLLHSGRLAGSVLEFSAAHATGAGFVASMGNETMVTTADVIDYLLEDESTRVVAMFLETIRSGSRFRELAEKALDLGKPLVAMKVGRSPGGQAAAAAHTGALAGDDAVTDAAFRQLGVTRVNSLEELLVTAGAMARYGAPRGRRMGVVTASGGACDVIEDLAHREGLAVPEFDARTVEGLRNYLPDFASSVQNPLDVTAQSRVTGPGPQRGPVEQALELVVNDSNIDFVLYMGPVVQVTTDEEGTERASDLRVRDAAATMSQSPVPVYPTSFMCTDVPQPVQEVLAPHGMHILAGLELGVRALGHAVRWAERRQETRPYQQPPGLGGSMAHMLPPNGAPTEWETQQLLARAGVPVIPTELVRDADEAVQAAARLGYPLAVKVSSPQITHKSDIGGVVLDVRDSEALVRAVESVVAAGKAVPGAEVQGALLAPMRPPAHELLVGVTRDPTFGLVLTVGIGGVFVEVLKDVAQRLLPVTEQQALGLLGELAAIDLLRGARGQQPADLPEVAKVVEAICRAAVELGDRVEALEVNPLRVDGSHVEALDALLVLRAAGAGHEPR